MQQLAQLAYQDTSVATSKSSSAARFSAAAEESLSKWRCWDNDLKTRWDVCFKVSATDGFNTVVVCLSF